MFRFLCALAALFVMLPAAEAQSAPPPVSAFARNPQIALPSISPNGRRIAMLSEGAGQQIVAVISRDGEPPAGANVSAVRVERLLWASDDILIIIASVARERGQWGAVDYTQIHALDLNRPDRLRELDGYPVGRVPDTGDLVVWGRSGGRGLSTMDPATGLFLTIDQTNEPVFGYALDANGAPIARTSYRVVSQRYVLETRSGEFWTVVDERREEQLTTRMWGLLAGTNDELVFSERPPRGGERLYTVSLETGQRLRTLYENEEFDFDTLLRDYYTNTIIGLTIHEDMPLNVWFDEDFVEVQRILDGAIPDAFVSILSWSTDRTQFTVAAFRENRPPEYFLFDASSLSLAPLGAAYPELAALALPQRLSVRYRASDGTSIPAYLTLPEGEGPHPLIVLPHGGPVSRDTGGFDYIAHFFATRGYLVLQPNFRGSGGYGAAWEEAGWGEWATGVMQSDLSDGLNAMVQAGYAIPGRACIVGASYGGYAALAGATFTPDTYQCAAAIAPVTDLWLIVRYADGWGDVETPYSRRLAQRLTGDTQLPDRATVRGLSPINHVENVQIPILLIHGREDSVVDDEHSTAMNRALERADKDVSYVHISELDHWLTSEEMRTRVLTELENFVDEHIGD
ncbi:alpha/beta hydrolase family protein [Maricaulis salignorans]|uniref:S9 family peptidase n=1 Tax=Maricaulis salignorans TaxID=144026 RepID=UPI003A91D202